MTEPQGDKTDIEEIFPEDPQVEQTSKKSVESDRSRTSKLTPIFRIDSEKSLARNRKFIKDLEIAKARLRTYAAYSPTSQELQQRKAEYRKHLQKHTRKSVSS